MAVALILVSAIIPTSITNVINANQTGWGTAEIALWAIIPTMAIIGIFLLLLKEAGISVRI